VQLRDIWWSFKTLWQRARDFDRTKLERFPSGICHAENPRLILNVIEFR